ncbi:MAG: CheR family methyltransferase, partial [Myxococcaceae bacterium]
MSPHDPQLVEHLSAFAAALTGFSPAAIRREAVVAVLAAMRLRGFPDAELLEACRANDEELGSALCEAVLVGETYFFRHPEHFEFAAARLASVRARPGRVLRAWSAGCSSGEEAYSLAACLLAVTRGAAAAVEVVGTDLNPGALARAKVATYGPWSLRDSGPLLYPVLERAPDAKLRVLDGVRLVTRFERHNLLSPAAPLFGQFDLVFCRNALTYFTPAAVKLALSNLTAALAPGGALVLATMEADEAPEGLERIGPPGLQIFARARQPAPPPLPGPPPPRRPAGPEPRGATPTTIRAHLQALELIEKGDRRRAEQVLWEIR